MIILHCLPHNLASLGTATAVLYTTTVTVTALTAVYSRTRPRRQAAYDVLVLLLGRPPRKP